MSADARVFRMLTKNSSAKHCFQHISGKVADQHESIFFSLQIMKICCMKESE